MRRITNLFLLTINSIKSVLNILSKLSPSNYLQITEKGQILEVCMGSLDADETSHLLQRAENFQLAGMHFSVWQPESEVRIDVLEPVERSVQYGYGAFDYGAALEGIDIVGVQNFYTFTVYRE